VKICLPGLPNEIFVAFISSGFNFEEQRSLPRETCPFFCLIVFNQGVPEVFKQP
jgi:hypothetical protein